MHLTKKILPLTALMAVALPGTAMAAPKAKIKYQSNSVLVRETDGTATLTLTRAGKDLSQEASVGYATMGGTALAPGDFTQSSGRVTFPATTDKTQTATLQVPITDDAIAETTEDFQVVLKSPSRNAVAVNPKSVVTIADDDGASRIEFAQPLFRVSEAGGSATITVVRSGSTVGAAGADYATADGSATIADGDYTAATGHVSFAAGEVSKQFTVAISDDSVPEATEETVGLNLSNLTGADAGGNALASLAIVDDDSAPAIQFSADSLNDTVAESDPEGATLSVVRSGTLAGTVTVDYTTTDGTALAGSDYVGAPAAPDNELSFGPGEYEQIVSVPVTDDSVDESDETFTVGLANGLYQGSTPVLGTDVTANVSILDDDEPAAPVVENSSNTPVVTNETVVINSTTTPAPVSSQDVLGSRQSACGLTVKLAKKQKLLKQRVLKLRLRAGETCKVSLSAIVKQLSSKKKTVRSAKALRFKGKHATVTLQAGKAKTVKVKFTKRTLKAVSKALEARKRLQANVVVTERDSASKVTRRTLKITIRR